MCTRERFRKENNHKNLRMLPLLSASRKCYLEEENETAIILVCTLLKFLKYSQ